jgi:hypothetical protein
LAPTATANARNDSCSLTGTMATTCGSPERPSTLATSVLNTRWGSAPIASAAAIP